jgi:hypothetical protein
MIVELKNFHWSYGDDTITGEGRLGPLNTDGLIIHRFTSRSRILHDMEASELQNLGLCSVIDCCFFPVPLKNFSLIWRRQHYRWRAAKRRPILGAQGFWAGWDFYRDTCCDTRPRFFRSHPKDRPILSPLTAYKGMWRIGKDLYCATPAVTRGFCSILVFGKMIDWLITYLFPSAQDI